MCGCEGQTDRQTGRQTDRRAEPERGEVDIERQRKNERNSHQLRDKQKGGALSLSYVPLLSVQVPQHRGLCRIWDYLSDLGGGWGWGWGVRGAQSEVSNLTPVPTAPYLALTQRFLTFYSNFPTLATTKLLFPPFPSPTYLKMAI